MCMATDRTSWSDSADFMALDWESVGRLVRQRTLEVVAMHFAAMGEAWHPPLPNKDRSSSASRSRG